MCSCKQLYLPPTINNSSRAAFAYISRSSDWQQQQRGIYLMRFVKNTSAPRYLFTFPLLWSLEDSARPMVTERQTVCAELWYKSIPFDYCCSLSGYCKQGVLLLLIYSQARQGSQLCFLYTQCQLNIRKQNRSRPMDCLAARAWLCKIRLECGTGTAAVGVR